MVLHRFVIIFKSLLSHESQNLRRKIMKSLRMTMVFMAASMVGTVFSDVNVPVDSGERTLTSSDIAGIGSAENLVKTGAGRLVINGAIFPSGWTGAVKVEGGYLRVAHVGCRDLAR
jgi:autotransporter-associated beta strand protein